MLCVWKVYLPPASIALAMTAHPPESMMMCTHSGVCATVHLFQSLCHFAPTPDSLPQCTYSGICATVSLLWSHTTVSLLWSKCHSVMCLCITLRALLNTFKAFLCSAYGRSILPPCAPTPESVLLCTSSRVCAIAYLPHMVHHIAVYTPRSVTHFYSEPTSAGP
jgi:hypothetical protein